MNISKPIDIPNKKNKNRYRRTMLYSSSSPESPNLSQMCKTKNKSVILKGTPFYNKDTVKKLIMECIPSITKDQAFNIVEIASNNEKATIIRCSESKANLYYCHLVENGLLVDLE